MAEQHPHVGQADLVADIGQDLFAADLVVEAGEQRLEGIPVHLVLGDVLEELTAHPGPGRDAQPVGLMLEDQGVDQVPGLQAAERIGTKVGAEPPDELVGVAPLHGHIVDDAVVDRLAVERGDRLIAPAHVGAQQLGQAVGDHEAEHGQDREDREQLALVATKDLKRHGVPRVSILTSGRGPASG